MSAVTRTIHCRDAIAWLQEQSPLATCSMVASMPDKSEFTHYTLEEWKTWFMSTAGLVMSRCSDDGVSVFFQSDIKVDGAWVDKGYLVQKAAEALGHELLFHKVVCRAPSGAATFGRPGYSHLLAFSKSLRITDLSMSTTDVIADNGDKTWTRGMGINACLSIAKFIATHTTSTTIVNPFCGEGSMLAAANHVGLNAIGIERSPKRAEKSREQQISNDGKNWAKPL